MVARHKVKISFWWTLCIALLIPIAAIVGVLIGDRTPPYDHDYGTIDAHDDDVVREGANVTVMWHFRQPPDRVCDGWVQREIWIGAGVSSTIACLYEKQPAVRASQLQSDRTDGKPDMLGRSFQLCPKAVAGPAKYKALTCYYCNPSHYVTKPICKYTPDIPFQIYPKK